MNVPRSNANLVYRNGQQPPPRPHYSRQQMPPRPNYPPLYEDYEYRYDSTRPAPRSRRSMDVPRSDPRYGPAALVDEMYNRRLPHRSPSLHNQPIPPHPHAHPHQPYQTHPPEPHRLSFDNAAHHLFNDLTTSRTFFIDLLDSFSREISGIKPYADTKIQETLWKKKIEKLDEDGVKQQERLRQHENTIPSMNPNIPPPPPPPKSSDYHQPIQTFYSTASRLVDALKTAANSVPVRTAAPVSQHLPPPPPPGFNVPPPPPPLSRRTDEEISEETESMKRLIKKLQGQYRDLCDLIEGSKRSARKCSELIKDLGILLDVLNNSGNLWRQGGVDG